MSGDDLARNTADAKLAIDRCEQELAVIKNGLRNLGQPVPNEEENTLIVKWIKIDGLPETAAPKLTINISSPIVSAQISKLYSGVTGVDNKSSAPNDTKTVSTEEETTTKAESITVDTASRGSSDDEFFDANTVTTENETKSGDAADAAVVVTGDNESPASTSVTTSAPLDSETSTTTESKTVSEEVDVIVTPVTTTESGNNNDTYVTFRGVEVLQATISIDAIDADIPLGSSVAYELLPHTSQLFKSDTDAKVYTSQLPVAIFPPSNDNDTNNDYDGLEIALCTVTIQLEYIPSLKDKREELFGQLTAATKKKEIAIEKLRKAAMAQATATAAATRAAGAKSTNETSIEQQQKPAVKAGFLNKKSTTTKGVSSIDDREDVTTTTAISMSHAIMKMYDQYFGPTSFIRMYVPLAKNYILFFGFVALSHFKGYMFALPQPV